MKDLINQALSLHKAGKLDQAEKTYLKILSKDKNNPTILQLLGTLYLQLKKVDLSEDYFLQSLRLDPKNPNTLNNLGILKKNKKEINKSLEYFNFNIKNNNFLKSWINKSNIFLENSRFKEGLELSKQALKNFPTNIKLRNNYAIFLFECGYQTEAFNVYNQFEIDGSHYIESYLSYSSLLIQINNFPKALENLNKLLTIDEKNLDGLRKRHYVYKSLMNFEKAEKDLLFAISINKLNFLNNKMLVEFYIDIKKYELSIKYCNLMIQKKIQKDFFLSKKIISQIHIGDWHELKEMIDDFNKSKSFNTGMNPLALKYINDDPLIQKLFTEKYKEAKLGPIYNDKFSSTDQVLEKKSKIRIGFFSGDFRNHAVFHSIQDLFVNYDKSNFEIFAYSTHKTEDPQRNKIIDSVDGFHDIDSLSDKESFHLIRSHSLDVAIDLSGYTSNNKSHLFEHDISKIKINYFGFPGTIGSKKYTYILSDHHVIPGDHSQYYSEEVIYLPDTFMPFTPQNFENNVKRSDFNLPEDKFIISCFSKIEKILPNVFNIWMKVLSNFDDVSLALCIKNEMVQNNLKIYCEQNNYNFNKIIFLSPIEHNENLKRMSTFDLYLDTYPYNGHVAISDSLFQSCVPTISFTGKSYASRVSFSLLKYSKLDNLITFNEIDYYNKINYFCSNRDELKKIKKKLIEFKFLKLNRMKEFTKNFEKLMKSIVLK